MINFVLICHKGELEYQALFLVWSLKKYLLGKYNIYVAIPDNKSIAPSNQTLSTLAELGCKTYYFSNVYLSKNRSKLTGDKCSNKIYALKALKNNDTIVFLDSDIIAIQQFNTNAFSSATNFVAKPVNRAHNISWQKLYHHFGLPMPKNSVKTGIDRQDIPPYFNSGVLIIPPQNYTNIIAYWEDLYLELSDKELLAKDYYPVFFRDQIALALAVQKLKLKFELLNEHYNYPIRGKKLPTNTLPLLVHYHRAVSIASYKALRKLHTQFLEEHAWTKEIMPNDWKFFFCTNTLSRIFRVFIEKLKYEKYLIKTKLKSSRNTSAKNQLPE